MQDVVCVFSFAISFSEQFSCSFGATEMENNMPTVTTVLYGPSVIVRTNNHKLMSWWEKRLFGFYLFASFSLYLFY